MSNDLTALADRLKVVRWRLNAAAIYQDSREVGDIEAALRQHAAGGNAVSDVLAERQRQDAKWGEQNHDPFTYLTVLGEEYGELCQAALHLRFGGPAADSLRDEAVQTAAVALAIVECFDRGKWWWGRQDETPHPTPTDLSI